MKYQPTIGLEIHLQLKTASKMFCACQNPSFDAPVNTFICPVCFGHPGTLPTINQQAVEMTLLLGLALNGQIQKKSYFERKNYFYPDLPKGYQISQKTAPLVKNASLVIGERKIRIREIHLEEDTAKLYHFPDKVLIDFNRAGLPLLELVTEPDLHSAQEAKRFCQELQLIARALNISEANLEKGEMRCEVNISLGKKIDECELNTNLPKKNQCQSMSSLSKSSSLGTKVEIKNLNSFRAVERAIEYEIKRQKEILEKGKKIFHETRGWNENKQKTVEQRFKEEVADYRYFPEPDLPLLEIEDKLIQQLKNKLPELPMVKRKKLIKRYQIEPFMAYLLTKNEDLVTYLEKVIKQLKKWFLLDIEEEGNSKKIWLRNKKKVIKKTVDWLVNRLMPLINDRQISFQELKISPENFAEFISLILTGRCSSKIAQLVLEKMFITGKSAEMIINEEDLTEINNEQILARKVEQVIQENQKAVKDYRQGKTEALKFLIGKTMLATRGKANLEIVKKILLEKLK